MVSSTLYPQILTSNDSLITLYFLDDYKCKSYSESEGKCKQLFSCCSKFPNPKFVTHMWNNTSSNHVLSWTLQIEITVFIECDPLQCWPQFFRGQGWGFHGERSSSFAQSVHPSPLLQHSLRLTWESVDLPHPRGQEKALTGKACCSQEAVVLKTFKEDSHSCQWAWQVFHFLFGAAQLCRLLSFTCKSNHHPSFTLLFFFSQRIAIERCSVLKSPKSQR